MSSAAAATAGASTTASAWTTSASAATTTAAPAAMRTRTTIAAARRTTEVPRVIAIEVRLAFLFFLGAAFITAFEGHATGCAGFRSPDFRPFCTIAAAHLGALLFQNRFARQLDAVAIDCQHLHQDLVAFMQFVLHILNPMLGDFTDV